MRSPRRRFRRRRTVLVDAAGLPVGVIPAAVLGVSSHPAW
jgi:hypothetical protein